MSSASARLILALCLFAAGCATPPQGEKFQRAPVSADAATVYVYRPLDRPRAPFASPYPNIFVNGERKLALREGTYRSLTLAPGEHEIKVAGSFATNWGLPPFARRVSFEQGREYFLRLTVSRVAPHVKLELVPVQVAAGEIPYTVSTQD